MLDQETFVRVKGSHGQGVLDKSVVCSLYTTADGHQTGIGRKHVRRLIPPPHGPTIPPCATPIPGHSPVRPPKEPEWGESAISWAKASDNGVKCVFKERFGGVPPRDERLWGMLRTSPTKSWSSTGAGDGSSVASSRKAPPV